MAKEGGPAEQQSLVRKIKRGKQDNPRSLTDSSDVEQTELSLARPPSADGVEAGAAAIHSVLPFGESPATHYSFLDAPYAFAHLLFTHANFSLL
jgi:hypothetical protein